MDKKTHFNLENAKDVEYLLNYINDDMAEDSEAEGDEDAEDNLTIPENTSQPSSSNNFIDNNTDPAIDIILNEELERRENQCRRKDPSESSSEESDSEYETDRGHNWKRHFRPPQTVANTNFDHPFGISNIQLDLQKPSQILETILTVAFLQYICDESNIYAKQKNAVLNLSIPELRAFIGIVIIMGLHVLPSMRMYWSNNRNFQVDRIKMVMPLKRFLKILRYVHLNNNETMPKKGHPNYDKCYKIRPFIE
ncbi:Transposase IS4 [Popillia japonica]|uniref:Transposase IS4 n=1 Tax=Popillia japonica TaxID=7064 RepID=A0AAW1KCE2_POPJA